MANCQSCGNLVKVSDKFCASCGVGVVYDPGKNHVLLAQQKARVQDIERKTRILCIVGFIVLGFSLWCSWYKYLRKGDYESNFETEYAKSMADPSTDEKARLYMTSTHDSMLKVCRDLDKKYGYRDVWPWQNPTHEQLLLRSMISKK